MVTIFYYSIASVLLVSIISFVGALTLSLHRSFLHNYLFILVGLAVGALIGDAFLHLIPDAFENTTSTLAVSIAIISGILIFFILEKIMHWHHHHDEGNEECAIHPTGPMILVSDGIHNFIDGLIIGVSYLAGIEIGLATTFAILIHEIPQEIGDFGILLHAGYSIKRALWLNFLSALTAVIGTGIALFLGTNIETFIQWLVPVAAGGFIYIALSDLIPEIHKTKKGLHSLVQFFAMLCGIVIMFLLLLLE